MDLNLDFSCDLVNLALGNGKLSNKLSSNGGFEDLLSNLDLSLSKNDEDKNLLEKLIQNLIANLNNLKQFNNLNGEKEELLNSINENILAINNKSNLNFEILDINEIINLNIEELNEYINSKVNFNMLLDFDLDKMSKNTDDINLNLHKNVNSDIDDLKSLDNQVKSLKSYEELNVSSNINKQNFLDLNKKEDKKDTDLGILENIVDKNVASLSMMKNQDFTQNLVSSNNLEQVTIRESNLGDDFIKMVKYLKNNNIEEIKVNIKPRELGDMTIKLLKDSQDTKIFIHVSKEETFNMLNKNLHDINKHLSDLGIKANDVVVELKSNDQNFFSDNLSQEFNRNQEQQNKKKNSKNESKHIEIINEFDEKIDDSNLNILA